jgi:tetratricopeptide (TPR) repeat protein
MGRTVAYAVIGLSALSALLLSPLPAGAEEEASARGVRVGEALVPRAVAGLDGAGIALPAKEGVTVVVFWATWSPRSEPLLKFWVRQHAEYAAREHPFSFVAVNADHQELDAEKRAAVKAYVEEKGITLPVAVDDRLEVYNLIGVKSLPTTYFFKSDGTLAYEEAGFPTSASIDMPEALDRELGIARAAVETDKPRGQLSYQPKNNALLYYNMGVNLAKMKMKDKARGKYREALQRDPDYADPVKALEDDFFRDGRTDEAVAKLREYLVEGNLQPIADRYQ